MRLYTSESTSASVIGKTFWSPEDSVKCCHSFQTTSGLIQNVSSLAFLTRTGRKTTEIKGARCFIDFLSWQLYIWYVILWRIYAHLCCGWTLSKITRHTLNHDLTGCPPSGETLGLVKVLWIPTAVSRRTGSPRAQLLSWSQRWKLRQEEWAKSQNKEIWGKQGLDVTILTVWTRTVKPVL